MGVLKSFSAFDTDWLCILFLYHKTLKQLWVLYQKKSLACRFSVAKRFVSEEKFVKQSKDDPSFLDSKCIFVDIAAIKLFNHRKCLILYVAYLSEFLMHTCTVELVC